MKIAFVLFDGMTTLDFAGFFEAITWMGILGAKENVTWDFCSNKEEITDDRGLTVKVTHVYPDLSVYDLLFVPGGFATRSLRFDAAFITWLQTSGNVTYKVSVCTGALLLGAAGFLHGKKATTNPSAYELLTPYCSEVVKKRIVRDGNLFTGGGVSASIDLGLFVIESLTDSDFAQQVQQKMDYPYYQAGQISKVSLE
ncbi:DJ-1/PfpI family protein [Paenibacillus sp. LMG 31460]|uniref:DJ-1/PfpI family protein n=1 Tax=Paenibacillus germinis TaxID=2654979 RepID=A0ABX1YZZ2_9BACL|nr:DJ-1/PfpI family protein [Paenibacillus germinis]NOU86144.1 DJ-1/PfpI family protein [Paenibacillus germinis]